MSDQIGSAGARGVADPDSVGPIRQADSLSDLASLLDAPSESAAYFQAKDRWAGASEATLRPGRRLDGLPGDRIVVGDLDVTVHGLTHANTEAERTFVRDLARDYHAAGATVYCEQGIREMYLGDVPDVHAMDDYRWAMDKNAVRSRDCLAEPFHTSELVGLLASLTTRAREFREETYSLIESGRDLYGEELAAALGDVASSFLTGHENLATGDDFEAYRKTRRAARDPDCLAALQRYYWRAFLPQPLEREWLRRHDPELELLTHARNERMADYLVHDADTSPVSVLVGAAHQPGVIYYLRQYRDGNRDPDDFEYVA